MPFPNCKSVEPVSTMIKTALVVAGMIAATTSASAVTTSFGAAFSETGQSMWSTGPAITIDSGTQRLGPDPFNLGKTAGGFFNPCDPLGTCNTGAQIGAQATGNFGLEYGVKFNSGSVDLSYPLNATLTTPDPFASNVDQPFSVGSSFSVANGADLGQFGTVTAKTTVHSPTLQAFVNLDAQFHAFVGAQACVVGVCQGPFIGPPDIDKSRPIASVNANNDGKVQVGDTIVNLDQNVSTLDGDLTARLNIPNISATSSTAAGSTATNLVSIGRDNIAALDVNVGNIVAKALGLPLVGNVGPIGYNLLSANAGLALDVQQTVSVKVVPVEDLQFQSPVQELLAGGVWSAPTTNIAFDLGDSVTLKSSVFHLAAIPHTILEATLTNQTDLVVGGDFSLQAMGANAFGLQLGPLIDTGVANAGLIDIPVYDQSFSVNLKDITGAPINISQNPFGASRTTTNAGWLLGLGPLKDNGDPRTIVGHDLGLLDCSETQINSGACLLNQTVGQVSLTGYSAAGPTYIADPGSLVQTFVDTGPGDSDEGEAGLLSSVGYAPGLPPFNIPMGAPAPSVPEPATWTLMIVGLCAIGGAIRGRRGAARGVTGSPIR